MTVIVTDSCTVENAERIRQSLLEALVEEGETVLDFREVHDVDMSFFQMLVSAQRSFCQAGKSLIIHAPLDRSVTEKVRLAGIAALFHLENQPPGTFRPCEQNDFNRGASEEEELQPEVAS